MRKTKTVVEVFCGSTACAILLKSRIGRWVIINTKVTLLSDDK